MLRLEASFSKWSANLLVIYTRYWGRDSNAKLGLSPTKNNYLASLKTADNVNIYAKLTDLHKL